MLKIHYQINEEEEEGAGDIITGVFTQGQRGKKNNKGAEGDGGLGGLSGLKVGRKEIVTKDWKVMRRVYTAI